MRNFKELKIWQKGLAISVSTYKLTGSFPKEERFGITSQITRAAVSIPSNIAEGSSRSSDKDYHRFIEISLGSSFELETQLLICQRRKYGDQILLSQMLTDLETLQKMIFSYHSKILNEQ